MTHLLELRQGLADGCVGHVRLGRFSVGLCWLEVGELSVVLVMVRYSLVVKRHRDKCLKSSLASKVVGPSV